MTKAQSCVSMRRASQSECWHAFVWKQYNIMSPHSEQPLISTEKTPPLKQTFYDGAGLWFHE